MLIEEIISQQNFLDADYRFTPGMLEVKENEIGVTGVFTRKNLAEGFEIISLPVKDGSLTLLRAYEEAAAFLRILGSDRFNLGEDFIFASALYRRYRFASNESDVLFRGLNLTAAYQGSPMTAIASKAMADLITDNHNSSIENASQSDLLINKLKVDETLFRYLMAYSISRTWTTYGIIPGLDLFNSSYRNSANCRFNVECGRFSYTTLQNVKAGDELTWQYNASDAISTWLNYGYVDVQRPTKAILELHVDHAAKTKYEKFLKRNLDIEKDQISPRHILNQCRFDYFLNYPGKLLSKRQLHNEVITSVRNFITTRAWLRAFVLSGKNYAESDVNISTLGDDTNNFGLAVEQEVIHLMLTALDKGLREEYKRVNKFNSTTLGREIDMGPYINMRIKSHEAWKEVLLLIDKLLAEPSDAGVISTLFQDRNQNVNSRKEAVERLKGIDREAPSVSTSLSLRYLERFLL